MTPAFFKKTITDFYRTSRRSLPWRKTKNPYHILVSEIMLQQTQVPRVIPKYILFLKRFPTIQKLARTNKAEVLTIWSGLGYNRRALALKHLAEIVITKYGGRIPRETLDLEGLPGIGHYTARAIRVFAWNIPEVFIETNIRSVYIHFFFPKTKHVSDKVLLPLIEASLDKKNPRLWYSALMDYGAMLKQGSKNPSRQSRHHTKQSTFKGSVRELRGNIIRELIKKSPQTKQALYKKINDKRLSSVLKNLVHEGFLSLRGRTITLSS